MLRIEELKEAEHIVKSTIDMPGTDLLKKIDRYAGIALFALQLFEELIGLLNGWKIWKVKRHGKIIAALVRFVNKIRGLK